MIVDDNAAMRETIEHVLSGLGVEFDQCDDGSQAVSRYDEVMPDVVLMDIRMTGMDGLIATAEIKRSHPDASIIIVTNYDDREFRAEASRLGASGFVLKKDLTELRHIIGTSH